MTPKVHRSVSRSRKAGRRRAGGVDWKALFWRWFKWLSLTGLFCAVIGVLVVLMFLAPYYKRARSHDLSKLDTKLFPVPQASVVVDSEGRELGRIFIENREWVDYDQLPQVFIDALVSAEDQRFWEHKGVDTVGVIRAVLLNLKDREANSGASTLTQQLARGVFNLADAYKNERGEENSYSRKIEEIFLAQRIERHLNGDKKEIVEQYVNRIYFGNGCYGIGAATRHYFDKEVSQLTLLESASMVGLIRSPSRYNPETEPQNNVTVRNTVLERMETDGRIDRETLRAARTQALQLNIQALDPKYGHLFSAIRGSVSDLIGWEQASEGGYRVETTIDLGLQDYASAQLEQELRRIEQLPGYGHPRHSASVQASEYLEGSVILLDTQTGAVLAMVGGRDFKKSEFNFATQARRPAGTAFLPVVYAAAFTQYGGYSPISLIEDSPIDLRRVQVGGLEGIMGEWGMELPDGDADLRFQGPLPARRCLEQGKLAATVRLGERVGLSRVADTARALGVPIATDHALYNRLLIGQDDPGVTALEYARMYGSFARAGERLPATHLIRRITRRDGTVVYSAPVPAPPEVAIDPIAAWQVRSCLNGVLTDGVDKGIAQVAPGLGLRDLIGHSGTTYAFTDAWFVGANPRVACAVWCGFQSNRGSIVENGYAKDLLMPLWGRLMEKVAGRGEGRAPSAPAGVNDVEICRISGGLAGEGCYEERRSAEGVRFVRSSYIEQLRAVDTTRPDPCPAHPAEIPLDSQLISVQSKALRDQERFSARVSNILPNRSTVNGDDPYRAVVGVMRREEDDESPDVAEVDAVEPDAVEADAVEADAVEADAVEVLEPLPADLPVADPEPLDLIRVGE